MTKTKLETVNELVLPLCIVEVPIERLTADRGNPRRHSKKQLGQIRASIRQFGFVQPVLINAENTVLAGNGRLQAARDLGMCRVPAIRIDHLSEHEQRALVIADNKIALNATWDETQLVKELQVLASCELDFALEITGFETTEIDLMLEIGGASDEQATLEQAPADPDKAVAPTTRMGDLWLCGPHRVLCGDARNADHVARLMEVRTADMVFTDPPYNVPVAGHVRAKDSGHAEFAMASGEMTSADFTSFLSQTLGVAAAVSRQGALHYVCMDWRHIGELQAAGTTIYSELLNICCWAKTNAGMGSFYRSQHELVFVWKLGEGPYQNNVQLGATGRHRSNVWTYPGVTSFGADRAADLVDHPTVKPRAMVADAILDTTSRGDLILDPFLGSGTTLLAAHETKRIGYGLEYDPHYVDVILRRWVAQTGELPVHAKTGTPWVDPLQAEGIDDAA